MVPNSLGPGELLHQFGTDAQKDYWLPRLADGRELAGLRPDQRRGRIGCLRDGRRGRDLQGRVAGRGGAGHPPQLGQALHHARRRSAPCWAWRSSCAIPDGLLGGTEEIGITCALVPTDLDGVETGRRHIPVLDHVHERADDRQGRVHPAGEHHRRAGLCRARLDDADERAGRRAGHFAALHGLRRHRAERAYHRRLCAHPRAVQPAHRQVRRRADAHGPAGRRCLCDGRGAASDLRGARRGRARCR